MKTIAVVILLVLLVVVAFPQRKLPYEFSRGLGETAMHRIWLDTGNPAGIPRRWVYDQGIVNRGLEALWYATGDRKYLDRISYGMNFWLGDDGRIKDYSIDEYNIDHVTPGRGYVFLFKATKDPKYKIAAAQVREQLRTHPRTKEGGFWHKKIYPHQMWLDGLYMGEPFYAEYSATFAEDNWDDIANQFVRMEKNARDPKTGLLHHAWDESREQRWANKETGRSPHIWARAMGWFAMALVDVLDFFPKNHPRRAEIVAILNREAGALAKYQDDEGLWWDIVDMPRVGKNYHESSSAAMFVYALAKGVRQKTLPPKYLDTARKGWAGIKKEFIGRLPNGNLDWKGTVFVSGLGGNPYRDGSFDYYMSEKVLDNVPIGIGAAIQAAVEMERLESRRERNFNE